MIKSCTPVKIVKPSLDDDKRQAVLRGVVSPETLGALRVDQNYQREGLSSSSRREIARAFETRGKLPDIVLGMRGDRFQVDEDSSVILVDPVYIIDGQQRRNTALEYLARFPEEPIRLGATVHFNTNVKWERDLFHALNLYQTKVSPNVILRNIKEESPLLATVYGLTRADKEFALYGRVCWTHNMVKGDLISALSFTRLSLAIHAHLAAVIRSSAKEVPSACNNLTKAIGLPLARANVKEFWGVVDECWGLRNVQYKERTTHLRTTFLDSLTKVFSGHHDFWEGDGDRRLCVPLDLRRKLMKFPINDPEIMRLSGAGGQAREMLKILMVQHINSGKRTRRLSPRDGLAFGSADDDGIDDESDAA